MKQEQVVVVMVQEKKTDDGDTDMIMQRQKLARHKTEKMRLYASPRRRKGIEEWTH